MDEVLATRGLVKRFGSSTAVADLNLSLQEGDVFGFLGPNGAGKTTTLRILATVLAPTAGEVSICGYPLSSTAQVRPLLGYMPDFFGVYEDISVHEYLQFFSQVYGIAPHLRAFAVDETVAVTGIGTLVDKPVEVLSRGQKQRLGLARALLHKPRLLLLDEPASGLDPEARVDFRDIIHEISHRGTAVIISSHVLADLSDMCNKVGIIVQGSMRWAGEMRDFLRREGQSRRLRLKVLGGAERARELLVEARGVSAVTWDEQDLVFGLEGDEQVMAGLLRVLVGAEVPVVSFSVEDATLEQVYLELIRSERGVA